MKKDEIREFSAERVKDRVKLTEGGEGKLKIRIKSEYGPDDIDTPNRVSGSVILVKEGSDMVLTTIEGESENEVRDRLTEYIDSEVLHLSVLRDLQRERKHKLL